MAGKNRDPVENIRNLYEEDSRPIPYPVFMKCFDALLEDPPDPTPATPSDDLKPHLRAVCMALDLGIADQQDRESDRRQEFEEHVLPRWKEYLPEAEFKAFRELLTGKVRKRMERMRREEQKRSAEQHRKEFEETTGASARDRQDRFASAMKNALHEARETYSADQQTPASSEVKNDENILEDTAQIPVADDVWELIKALKDGKIPVKYNDPKKRNPLAKYEFHGQTVTVLLVRKKSDYFCLLETDQPNKNTPGAEKALEEVADEMSYEQKQPFSYERTIGGASLKIQLGKKGTYLVCRRPRKLEVDELAQTVQQLHKRLTRFLDMLESQSAESDND